MKNYSFEPFKNWFGYTRRERRASFILIVLIASLTGLRLIIPEKNISAGIFPVGQWSKTDDSITKKNKYSSFTFQSKPVATVTKRIRIELNSSDSASLESLPGIGPVLSARIIKYRNLLGGFAGVNQLREVYGLSEETYNLIKARVKVDSSAIRKISINDADYKKLVRFPYFDRTEINAILKYRELKGRIEGMDILVNNKLIATEKAGKLRPYLEFE